MPLDATTGTPVAGEQPVAIARRQFAPNAEENPTIAFHDGYYYLFVSWDYCCRSVESDYRTIVGRSPSLTGPYVDADGVPLLDAKGGTEILRGYNEFVGAGGGDLLMDKNGRSGYFVNHYYDATDGGAPRLNVRKLTWGRDGWPVISDPINPSRSIGHGDAFVQIVPRDGTAVVENAGCGYEGANIALWTDLDNACQQWQLSDRGTGTRILNRFSNNVAEVGACTNVDGGNVAQWGWLGFLPNNDCQRWSFSAAGDGWTTVASILPGNRVWTVQGGPVPGSNLAISSPTGGADQQFRFEPVGEVLLASPTDQTNAHRAARVTRVRSRSGRATSAPVRRGCSSRWPGPPAYTVRTAGARRLPGHGPAAGPHRVRHLDAEPDRRRHVVAEQHRNHPGGAAAAALTLDRTRSGPRYWQGPRPPPEDHMTTATTHTLDVPGATPHLRRPRPAPAGGRPPAAPVHRASPWTRPASARSRRTSRTGPWSRTTRAASAGAPAATARPRTPPSSRPTTCTG